MSVPRIQGPKRRGIVVIDHGRALALSSQRRL